MRGFHEVIHEFTLARGFMFQLSEKEKIESFFSAIRRLMAPPDPKKRRIGFLVKERAARYGKMDR